MPKKDRPLVDRHPQKNGEGWLLNEQERLIVCFRNALPSAHAKWIELETRPMRGNGQPIVRRMLRHNAIEAWSHMQKTGWVRCQPRWCLHLSAYDQDHSCRLSRSSGQPVILEMLCASEGTTYRSQLNQTPNNDQQRTHP